MKILIIDDHKLFLEGVRYVLSGLDADAEVEEATNANRALQLIDRGTNYKLILVDLALPGLDGFAFLQAMRQRKCVIPIVMLSASTDVRDIHKAITYGALGYIPKSYSSNQMISALQKILAGNIYIPEQYIEKVNQLFAKGGEPANNNNEEQISERKLEVLKLLAAGHSNKEIASVLQVTEATIKAHVSDLLRLFEVKNRTACIAEAQKRKLVS
ncbi:MAG: response regulator [Arenicella sp.]